MILPLGELVRRIGWGVIIVLGLLFRQLVTLIVAVLIAIYDQLAGLSAVTRALDDGDPIVIDVEAREVRVELSADELEARLRGWEPPAPRYATGVFAKYAALVSSASEGAVTRARP